MADWTLLVFLTLSFLVVMGLGYLQARMTGRVVGIDQYNCCSDPGFYGVVALIVIIDQAGVTLLYLGGTPWFPLGALFLAFTLLCHHTIIHWNSRFEGEDCSCAPFQCKDVGNHETWVVAAVVAGLISWLRV